MTFSHVMWEYLFLVCMVLLAVVLTFPKKSQIRRVVTTTPMLLRNIIKTRSVKNGLRPFIGEGGCHNKGGNCCSNKVTFLKRNFLFFSFTENEERELNPQAVGRDSGVSFSFSNFQEDDLQPTRSKMSPTSNLGL